MLFSAYAQNLQPPYVPGALYWINEGICDVGRFNLQAFFFGAPDGSELLSAQDDLPRLVSALEEAIGELPQNAACANMLGQLLQQAQGT
jgi:hypothetical protein